MSAARFLAVQENARWTRPDWRTKESTPKYSKRTKKGPVVRRLLPIRLIRVIRGSIPFVGEEVNHGFQG